MLDGNILKDKKIIKVELSLEDLENLGKEIATNIFGQLQDKFENTHKVLLSPEEVCKLFSISRVTLWSWDKKGITKPIRIGNLKRYLFDDIHKIIMKTDEDSFKS